MRRGRTTITGKSKRRMKFRACGPFPAHALRGPFPAHALRSYAVPSETAHGALLCFCIANTQKPFCFFHKQFPPDLHKRHTYKHYSIRFHPACQLLCRTPTAADACTGERSGPSALLRRPPTPAGPAGGGGAGRRRAGRRRCGCAPGPGRGPGPASGTGRRPPSPGR